MVGEVAAVACGYYYKNDVSYKASMLNGFFGQYSSGGTKCVE